MRKLQCVLIAILLLSANVSWGALAISTRALGTSHASNTQTTSVTVSSASPLIVSVFWVSGSVTVSSIAWNGTAMTLIGNTSSGTDQRVSVYGIKNPTPATGNLVVTWSGAVDVGNVAIITTTGGDTTTGWRSTYTRNEGAGAGPGVTVIDSVNGDLVFNAIAIWSATLTWDGGEATTSTTESNVGGTAYSWGLSTKAATGASTVVGATDVSWYAEVAVALIPAAAGGGETFGFYKRRPQ